MSAMDAVQQRQEASLVALLRDGDAGAFETLVRTHMPMMLRVARRFMRSEEDARDAVQDAFVSAFRSIRNFGANAQLSTWLHRIVINACLMRLRTQRRIFTAFGVTPRTAAASSPESSSMSRSSRTSR